MADHQPPQPRVVTSLPHGGPRRQVRRPFRGGCGGRIVRRARCRLLAV